MRALPLLEQVGTKTLQVLRGFGHAAFFTWDLIFPPPFGGTSFLADHRWADDTPALRFL